MNNQNIKSCKLVIDINGVNGVNVNDEADSTEIIGSIDYDIRIIDVETEDSDDLNIVWIFLHTMIELLQDGEKINKLISENIEKIVAKE